MTAARVSAIGRRQSGKKMSAPKTVHGARSTGRRTPTLTLALPGMLSHRQHGPALLPQTDEAPRQDNHIIQRLEQQYVGDRIRAAESEWREHGDGYKLIDPYVSGRGRKRAA